MAVSVGEEEDCWVRASGASRRLGRRRCWSSWLVAGLGAAASCLRCRRRVKDAVGRRGETEGNKKLSGRATEEEAWS